MAVKRCPFIRAECIRTQCQLWVKADDNCAIGNTTYSLNYLKEVVLSLINQIEEIKNSVNSIAQNT